MKKNLFLVLLLCSLGLHAQITRTFIPKPADPLPAPFDSTKNWHGKENISAFKGQQLYFFPIQQKFSSDPFLYFTSQKNTPIYNANTPATEVGGHTFEIINVAPYNLDSYSSSKNFYTLTLKETKTGKIYYFYYNSAREDNSQYIFVSHFNYLKSSYVGKEYVVLPTAISTPEYNGSSKKTFNVDINTGKEIEYNPSNNCYRIIDVSIYDGSCLSPIVYIITNGEHTTYFSEMEFIRKRKHIYENVVEKEEWDLLLKENGPDMMNAVINGEIKIGMPKRLLILSLGYPDSINVSSFSDTQYVYDRYSPSIYVYLNNDGLVTAWN